MSPVPPSAVAAVYANRRVLLVALLVSLGVVGGYWGKVRGGPSGGTEAKVSSVRGCGQEEGLYLRCHSLASYAPVSSSQAFPYD